MKVLLVYPQYPGTFWSFRHALKFVSKKAAFPPLGLLTVASMLPREWDKKLVDMNTTKLRDRDIKWADYVFISAMITQKESAKRVIKCCNQLGAKVIVGGPVFTTGYEEFEGVDHFILGEAEATLPQFLKDFHNGCAKRVYHKSDTYPKLAHTPVPLWSLINIGNYASFSLQYSRGCPHDCEFCDIVVMNGRVPRTKETTQILQELEAIYKTKFRGAIFIVDDNFIGNKRRVMEMLPEVIKWQKTKNYPFSFLTEASLNLSDDEELMRMMVNAGFDKVFIGLESPNEESLAECNKTQNRGRDMVAAVKKIQGCSLQVLGGFIVGFDKDPPDIFDRQIDFIQRAGVVIAMVGMLQALPGTRLYKRLEAEGRLSEASSGNNTDGSLNFIPRMDPKILVEGYKWLIQTIYSPENYYKRMCAFLEEYKPSKRRKRRNWVSDTRPLCYSIWHIGLIGGWKVKWYYWKMLVTAFFKYRQAFPEVVTLAIYGFHFRKVANGIVKTP